MNKTTVSLGSCIELASDSKTTQRVLLVPTEDDGLVRNEHGDMWLTPKDASQVLAEFSSSSTEPAIDIEHQTILVDPKQMNGPVLRYGSIKQLDFERGEGLYATIEWTSQALQWIKDGHYKYLSPTYWLDEDRHMTGLINAGLVQRPALTNARSIAEAASQNLLSKESKTMADEPMGTAVGADVGVVIGEIKTLLSLEVEDSIGTEAVLVAIRDALKKKSSSDSSESTAADAAEKSPEMASVRQALKLPDTAKPCDMIKAIDEMSGHIGYVPVTEYKKLNDRVATMEAASAKRESSDLVAEYASQGKLLATDKAQMEWASSTSAKDPAGFKAIMDNAPVLCPPGQTPPPASGGTNNSRERVIETASAEFDGEPELAKITSKRGFVNNALEEEKLPVMTEKEREAIPV